MMPAVLGIDPGLAATGFGVIAVERGRLRCLHFGVVSTDSHDAPGARLEQIYEAIRRVVQEYRPRFAGVENLYFTRNTTSAMPVAQARGVVLLALRQLGIDTKEFTPQQIKLAVVGHGGADKEQVAQLVRIVLGMTRAPHPDHAADALAAAITRAHWDGGRIGHGENDVQ